MTECPDWLLVLVSVLFGCEGFLLGWAVGHAMGRRLASPDQVALSATLQQRENQLRLLAARLRDLEGRVDAAVNALERPSGTQRLGDQDSGGG